MAHKSNGCTLGCTMGSLRGYIGCHKRVTSRSLWGESHTTMKMPIFPAGALLLHRIRLQVTASTASKRTSRPPRPSALLVRKRQGPLDVAATGAPQAKACGAPPPQEVDNVGPHAGCGVIHRSAPGGALVILDIDVCTIADLKGLSRNHARNA